MKFIILFLVFFLAWKASDVLFCKICPAATIEASIPYNLQHAAVVTTLFTARIIIFGFVVALIIVITRFWCRYLCPFGAWLAIFNKVSLIQVKINHNKCKECKLCEKTCPMGIEITKLKKSSERIKCGICAENCPNKAIEFKVAP